MSRALLPTLLIGVLGLSGCAAVDRDSRLELTLTPRPGRACGETTVGFVDTEVTSRDLGCDAVLSFDLVPAGQVEVAMPPPSDRSSAVGRMVKTMGLARRRLTFGDPRGRSDAWRVVVADEAVGADGLTLSEAKDYDLRSHRWIVFEILLRSRSGTVYPFPFHPHTRTRDLHDADPAYCTDESAAQVHLYPASDDARIAERTRWDPAERLAFGDVRCSHTHDHVFAVDLGGLDLASLDVAVELNNHSPRYFRLNPRPDDNYTVVSVIVEPLE